MNFYGRVFRPRGGPFSSRVRRARFLLSAIAENRLVFATHSLDFLIISASLAFTRPVISRLSLVLDMVKRVCLISGIDCGQFCTLPVHYGCPCCRVRWVAVRVSWLV